MIHKRDHWRSIRTLGLIALVPATHPDSDASVRPSAEQLVQLKSAGSTRHSAGIFRRMAVPLVPSPGQTGPSSYEKEAQ